jgi:histidinol phosphatase-like PHP family hydrolase
MFDLHTHTILSDGELVPSELIRRAFSNGYEAIGLTDHVDFSNIEHVLKGESKAKTLEEDIDIKVIVGVEITHVPPAKIGKLASMAKDLGAELVIVHGETIVEPVAKGTNEAAIASGVDILAHPGLITLETAESASENGVYLEITSRRGHCLANGHVVMVAKEVGAEMIISTDAHAPSDLITNDFAKKIAVGAGLDEVEARRCVDENPRKLLLLHE